MERRELESKIKSYLCEKGGTREACIKIRELLKNKIIEDNKLYAPNSCVSMEEFIQAVEVLTAYVANRQDAKVSLYHCESDCIYASSLHCPGELMVTKKGAKICPYYIEEDR